MVEALEQVDGILGILMDGLIQRGLLRCVNLVIVSDHGELAVIPNNSPKDKLENHNFSLLNVIYSEQNCFMLLLCLTGMEEASCKRGVFVSDYLNNSDEFSIIPGAAARIRPSRLPENFFSCEFS